MAMLSGIYPPLQFEGSCSGRSLDMERATMPVRFLSQTVLGGKDQVARQL